MSVEKVAVVTGANKGIGFEIVKGLCKKFQGVVYLTARNTDRGQAAVEKLKEQGFNPRFHQLDIDDQDSVNKFRDYIKNTHGGFDVLINNAGISLTPRTDLPLGEKAEETIKTNYFGTLRVCEALFPLLRDNAKVINFSSYYGFLKLIKSPNLRDKFSSSSLSIESLNKLMNKYVEDAKADKVEQEGWAETPYSVSKNGISALSIVQQRIMDKETPNRNVAVNFVHPGYVTTDLTRYRGNMTPEEGARSALYAAMEANVKGKFIWKDCQVVDWLIQELPEL